MLKIGILGVGQDHPSSSRRGRTLIRRIQVFTGVRVTAICDIDEASLESLQRDFEIPGAFTSMDEFLASDLDAVLISTPPPLHAEHSIAALEAGKHVACEVPAATTLDECAVLVETVEKTGKIYMMLENYCFHAFVGSWKAMIERDLLGKPFYGEGEYVHDLRWQFFRADGSKAWRADFPPIKYGTHALGPLLHIFGDRCRTAVGLGTGAKVNPAQKADDIQVGLFQLEGGGVVKVLAGFAVVREPKSSYYSVYGTKGFIETARRPNLEEPEYCQAYFEAIPQMNGMMKLPVGSHHLPEKGKAPPWGAMGGHGPADHFALQSFVRALQEGVSPRIDVYRSMDFTAPCICAHLSTQKGGTPVDVPDFR